MRSAALAWSTLIALILVLSTTAVADTCNDFATFTCAKSTPNLVRFGGGLASGQSVGVLLNSNVFNISMANGSPGADVIIIAAFPNSSPSGSLNGILFKSLSSFPEGGAGNAITSSLQAMGFCGSSCNLTFGYVDLGTALSANGMVTVTASGVPAGTALYAVVLNSKGQIAYITPNSEAAIMGSTATVPEPGTLALLGSGLVGLAGIVRRKTRR